MSDMNGESLSQKPTEAAPEVRGESAASGAG